MSKKLSGYDLHLIFANNMANKDVDVERWSDLPEDEVDAWNELAAEVNEQYGV